MGTIGIRKNERLSSHNNTSIKIDERAIDGIFRNLDQCHLPGAAVGIAVGGTPVYRKGFGLSSMELPLLLTPQTRLRIYSLTKHFTCLAYLLQCEAGKAEIDDPVGRYLPELCPAAQRVTMRQIMSNTSGLRDACDLRWFFSGIEQTVPASDLLTLYREVLDVNFAPGEAWCYNNGGFHILSAVIEKLADEPLEDVFRTALFEPVGMHDTTLCRVDTDFVPNSASMHTLNANGTYEKRFLPGALAGEGGIVSTVDDMLRWMRNFGDAVVGSSKTWSLMSTPNKLNNGVETGYGFGLFRRGYRSLDTISHSGGALGCNSQMFRVPSADLDIIVLVNRSDVMSIELARRILDVCFGLESESTRPHKKCVAGLFRSPTSGQVIHLYEREERQMASIDGGPELELTMTGEQELVPPRSSSLPFAIRWCGETANPDRICCTFCGNSNELMAVPAGSAARIEDIAGEYRAESIGVRLAIEQDSEGDGRVVTSGKFGSREYVLQRLGSGIWRLRSRDGAGWSGTLTVESDPSDLVLQTVGTWKVALRRSM